jgi:hypothetical protein
MAQSKAKTVTSLLILLSVLGVVEAYGFEKIPCLEVMLSPRQSQSTNCV